MNSKSTYHCRHSVNAFNIKELSKYYAIESRIYNSVFDKEKNKFVKGKLFFTNIMVFDFDFDEKHFPNIKDYKLKLNNSLNKLKSILGNPNFIITNKDCCEFSEEQIEKYFTKYNILGEKEINLPKKYGCQVVYELKNSVKSQYIEQYNLYKKVRMHITKLVDADINFKGNMFKNYLNKTLFNIEEFDEKLSNKIDIFDLALKFDLETEEDIQKIKSLKPFEYLDPIKNIPSLFLYYNSKLIEFYNNLNSWKTNSDFKENNLQSNKNNLYIKRSESRNESAFNFLKFFNLDYIKNLNYNNFISIAKLNNIFENCSIKEDLDENEFNEIKNSIICYKENNKNIELYNYAANINFLNSQINNRIDNRVFKFNICNNDYLNFFQSENNKILLYQSIQKTLNNLNDHNENNYIYYDFYMRKDSKKMSRCKIYLYGEDYDGLYKIISDLFFYYGIETLLSNINIIFNPYFVTEINKNLIKPILNKELGLYDMYLLFKDALFISHFKLYHSIKENVIKEDFNNLEKPINIKEFYGINFVNNNYSNLNNIELINKFDIYFNRILSLNNNLIIKLENNFKIAPISLFQNYFHIKNIDATKLKHFIIDYINFLDNKNFFMKKLNLNNKKDIKLLIFNYKYLKDQKTNFLVKNKNTSQYIFHINNNFIIDDNLNYFYFLSLNNKIIYYINLYFYLNLLKLFINMNDYYKINKI